MDVAAGEVLSNTYSHAYYSGIGRVFVEVFQIQRSATVVVVDMGDAVVAPVIPNTLPYPTRTGGRGLYLVSHLCDQVMFAVNRVGHGLTVRMTRWFEDAPVWPGQSDAKQIFESITARNQWGQSQLTLRT
jgi:anti-sigma regulatory factor (Ser/Thr protein kinase)